MTEVHYWQFSENSLNRQQQSTDHRDKNSENSCPGAINSCSTKADRSWWGEIKYSPIIPSAYNNKHLRKSSILIACMYVSVLTFPLLVEPYHITPSIFPQTRSHNKQALSVTAVVVFRTGPRSNTTILESKTKTFSAHGENASGKTRHSTAVIVFRSNRGKKKTHSLLETTKRFFFLPPPAPRWPKKKKMEIFRQFYQKLQENPPSPRSLFVHTHTVGSSSSCCWRGNYNNYYYCCI